MEHIQRYIRWAIRYIRFWERKQRQYSELLSEASRLMNLVFVYFQHSEETPAVKAILAQWHRTWEKYEALLRKG